MSGSCTECGNTQCLCREIAAWSLALKQAEEKGHASLATALREDGFDPKVDYSVFVESPKSHPFDFKDNLDRAFGGNYDALMAAITEKTRAEEIAERRKDTCPGCGINGEVTISHAVNTAVNGISQEVQTAMLLGGVSEGVFASVVQSIESYRLP